MIVHRGLRAFHSIVFPEPVVVPRQLPGAPSSFVGRHDALERFGGHPGIFAIAGPGGIGKTWLALHWAHGNAARFPDGQLFVDLRGFAPEAAPMPPEVALRGFLDALGVDRCPADLHAQTALFRSLVVDRRMLLVLDNAADTAQVVPLLPGGESCTVVVTSRRRLPGLVSGHGARHLALDRLQAPESRALLTDRLGSARIAADPAAVGDLIVRCDGFPLALSVLAGDALAHPEMPLARFAEDLREFGPVALDEDDSEACLTAVLSWSLRCLSPEQLRAFDAARHRAGSGHRPGRGGGPARADRSRGPRVAEPAGNPVAAHSLRAGPLPHAQPHPRPRGRARHRSGASPGSAAPSRRPLHPDRDRGRSPHRPFTRAGPLPSRPVPTVQCGRRDHLVPHRTR
ncbi:hypothetical protein FXN61_07845 [Lentzea sp. PSKA42]|uniref:NB-ARC domain-containing protein n=1 Tax=Lentzea indica TaxID=2604800 RepID=A0ABX1FCR6_9PSEU|nr:hypothetical protein [Lentzea indica]